MEIARIHVEALGGAERVRAVSALRMRGSVAMREMQVRFTLTVARPARLRMETHFRDRTVVQASDGEAPPWEFDRNAGLLPRAMPAEVAQMFLVDAEFDDPLVAAVEGRVRIEFAGETVVRGERLWRILVVRSLAENVFVLVDPDTYLITLRGQHVMRAGMPVEVVSRYGDFRPVAGVILPHHVVVHVGGEQAQEIRFERIEANPSLPQGYFSRLNVIN